MYFQYMRCPEAYQVDLAAHYLAGDAHLWWRSVLAKREQRLMVLGDFLLVREYNVEFSRLLVYSSRAGDPEQMQVRQFIKGLNHDMRVQCKVQTYASRVELVEVALGIEDELRSHLVISNPSVQQKMAQPNFVLSRGGKPAQGHKRKRDDASKVGKGGRGYFGCGSMDHKLASCPKKNEPRVETRVCFHYKETGHIKARCHKAQKMVVAAL
ncbi:uncharacterized protein LOC111832095 [Capsella rubella]|uniref:uncharacterized protein LOC111832095 n=1 Tax=Capsella rubella TaxID=81985 RepID=UPI000CD4EB14|nr:uncharacterized protein LOC111832095 [Capsella rubella]